MAYLNKREKISQFFRMSHLRHLNTFNMCILSWKYKNYRFFISCKSDHPRLNSDCVKCLESTDMNCSMTNRPEVLYKQAKVALDSFSWVMSIFSRIRKHQGLQCKCWTVLGPIIDMHAYAAILSFDKFI